jgi:hypothetical protein
VELLRELNPEVIVVVAFGQILTKEILDMPKYGCVNVHASLLPKYRGAAPIQWAVIDGEVESGVTTMLMDEGIDTGDMLMVSKYTLDAKETGGNFLELFPNRLVINEEAQDITVDKKRISCLRPSYLVSSVRKNQEKMGKASFNEQRFLDDVYTAYEAIIALETVKNTKKNKVITRSVKLTDIYKKMAPTARAKKDYDMLNFAYDISRVYSLDEKRAKNGMRMEIDTARGVDKNAIRILDAYGNEYFLTTIKFIENDL